MRMLYMTVTRLEHASQGSTRRVCAQAKVRVISRKSFGWFFVILGSRPSRARSLGGILTASSWCSGGKLLCNKGNIQNFKTNKLE